MEVESVVSQGSVLGAVHFNLFENDLELGVSSELTEFDDYTKLFRVSKTEKDCKLNEQAIKWRMHLVQCIVIYMLQ